MNDLDELRRLSDAATPGPWAFEADSEGVQIVGEGDNRDAPGFITPTDEWTDQQYADAAFIVAAVNYVRELLRTPLPVPGEGE